MKNSKRKTKKLIAAALISTGLIGTAFIVNADNRDMKSNETAAITEASVTINQAVDIALAAVPGTAKEAEFEVEDGKSIWEIEIVDATQQVYKLDIDAASGEVLEQKLKDDDHKDRKHRKHRKNKHHQDKA